MDQAPRRNRDSEEIARVREIVSRHDMPSFVSGFDVKLGDFDGDPALWVIFKVTAQPTELEMSDHLMQRAALREAVQADLLDVLDNRFPFFRFQQA